MVKKMSDENQFDDELTPEQLFGLLKEKAKMLGITHSNNIGYDALLKKVNDKLEGVTEDEPAPEPAVADAGSVAPVAERKLTEAEQKQNLRKEIMAKQMALVRIRLTCMDPKKKDLPGEFICVANDYIGNVKKFIPFGEATDNGYHVPKCILTALQERKYLQIRTKKDQRTGIDVPENKYVREFAIEILPPLTREELKKLATAQIAAGTSTVGTDD